MLSIASFKNLKRQAKESIIVWMPKLTLIFHNFSFNFPIVNDKIETGKTEPVLCVSSFTEEPAIKRS